MRQLLKNRQTRKCLKMFHGSPTDPPALGFVQVLDPGRPRLDARVHDEGVHLAVDVRCAQHQHKIVSAACTGSECHSCANNKKRRGTCTGSSAARDAAARGWMMCSGRRSACMPARDAKRLPTPARAMLAASSLGCRDLRNVSQHSANFEVSPAPISRRPRRAKMNHPKDQRPKR